MIMPTVDRLWKGIPRPYDEALALGVIDPRVRSLVQAFNVRGEVRSLASCEGHGLFQIHVQPYVAFVAPVPMAAKFSARLDADAVHERPRLGHAWSITARFDDEGQLVYRLSLHEKPRALWWLCRKRLDDDFAALEEMAKESFRTGVRQRAELDGSGKCCEKRHGDDGAHQLPLFIGALFAKGMGLAKRSEMVA